ncbi:MAG: alpha/beta hydrolase [Cycloclasticus sp.]|nr:alpha/beta hydrolase [Cycloclasticus sp.]MBQ0789340.1 alpha/beta hydrolase [Cycloclasticus sp.]
MKTLFKLFKLTLRTHGNQAAWDTGHIFLFNHFARFETFIPQYLIYDRTRLLSRSIASKELFGDNILGRYLKDLGGIPNNADNLMYLVAKDILNNHKLVAFPEGGIVKDRRSIDNAGRYRVYSRSHGERRKHHSGPAVIALAVAIFKSAVREISKDDQHDTLSLWSAELGFKDKQALIDVSKKPTLIIPCNITFYPLRISGNALTRGVQFFFKNVQKRLSEELLIEGNFLLKDTDMDIQIGTPIIVENYWTKFDSALSSVFTTHADLTLNDIFLRTQSTKSWNNLLFRLSYQRNALKIRDVYMREIYVKLTINIAHIAATIIMQFVKQGKENVKKQTLHRLIYLVIKALQQYGTLNFHRTLQNPAIYRNLLTTYSQTFDQFLRSAYRTNLLRCDDEHYIFTNQITLEHDFDSIRYKNPMAVYANEVSPIKAVKDAVLNSMNLAYKDKSAAFASLLIDDEVREYEWDKALFKDKRYEEINAQQQFDPEAAEPFILMPKNANAECVVLIHGLLSTPAEMHGLAIKLQQQGYLAIGCRLKGHGTSPWDLKQRSWQDWRQSVLQSIHIAHQYSDKVHLVGFSTGSLLSLLIASENALNISSVSACSTPIELKDPWLPFVKLANGINFLSQKFLSTGGFFAFNESSPEHPNINYHHVPITSVNQLLLLIKEAKKQLHQLACPVLLMHAENDPIVDPCSLSVLLKMINKPLRQYQWVASSRHGILYENSNNCQQSIIDFIKNPLNSVK